MKQSSESIANHYLTKTDTEAKVMLTLGKPIRSNAKLTRPKRKQFLQEYHKTKNKSRSAIKVGVTVQAINKLIKSDEEFRAAFEFVNDLALDDLEEVSFNLGSSLTREGFNDRKLLLMANRPEKYNPKTEIDVKVDINNENYTQEMRRILGQYVTSKDRAITTTYRNINDNNDLEKK